MNIEVTLAKDEHTKTVQQIFEACPSYFLNTENSNVLPHFAKREMSDCPPKNKQTETYRKEFCLVYLNGTPIGIVDLHKDHPSKETTYIGLLLLMEKYHGKGIGQLVYKSAEGYAQQILGASKIVLGVSEDNDVERFWKSVGFTRNSKIYTWKSETHSTQVFEMEKILE